MIEFYQPLTGGFNSFPIVVARCHEYLPHVGCEYIIASSVLLVSITDENKMFLILL